MPPSPLPSRAVAVPAPTLSRSAVPALVCLSLCTVMPSLDASIANVGLPTLERALSASFQQVQWIVLIYLLAITSLIVSVGRLGDALGRKRLLITGVALFTAASLVCGLASSLPWLLVARALQGLGAAIMIALALAMVGESVPKERTGRAMGLLATVSSVGTTVGPAFGGFLISTLGWRSIFLVNVPIGVATIALALRALPDRVIQSDAAPRASIDGVGTALLAASLSAYALAMTLGHGDFGRLNGLLLAAAFAGSVLFVLVERRSKRPLLPWALIGDRTLFTSILLSLVVATVVMTNMVVGPFYLSRGLGLGTAAIGLTISVAPLSAALVGIPAGRLVDRYGAGRMSAVGLGGMVLGLLLLCFESNAWGIVGYAIPVAIVSGHYALFQASNNTRVIMRVGAGQRGVISGTISLARYLGFITGAAVMGAVFAFVSAHAGSGSGWLAGMRAAYAVATAMVLIAVAVTALLTRPRTS